MAAIKTRPTGDDVTAFLDSVADERRRAEGHAMRALFERITGEPATMWGPSMVGFIERLDRVDQRGLEQLVRMAWAV